MPSFPFLGSVTGDRVRIRTAPRIAADTILMEYDKGQWISVVGQEEGFYQIKPSSDWIGYISRRYVFDGLVSANEVNVRTAPHLDAPVIARLNEGEQVNATVCTDDPHWLEISLPSKIVFYLSKEFVKWEGDRGAMEERMQKEADLRWRFLQFQKTLQEGANLSQKERLNLFFTFQHLLKESSDDRILYQQINNRLREVQEICWKEEAVCANVLSLEANSAVDSESTLNMTDQMRMWLSAEHEVFSQWMHSHGGESIDDFYRDERERNQIVKGIVLPYRESVVNKPGDFLLVDLKNIPQAYLYSTQVNLEKKVGQMVTLCVVPRPNHGFAFPAYYVLPDTEEVVCESK